MAGRRQLPRPEVEHKGQRHLIDFNRAALNAIHAKLIDWGIAPDAFAWPPRHNPKALPYPGLDRSAIADYRKALSVRIDEPTKKQIERALKELGVERTRTHNDWFPQGSGEAIELGSCSIVRFARD